MDDGTNSADKPRRRPLLKKRAREDESLAGTTITFATIPVSAAAPQEEEPASPAPAKSMRLERKRERERKRRRDVHSSFEELYTLLLEIDAEFKDKYSQQGGQTLVTTSLNHNKGPSQSVLVREAVFALKRYHKENESLKHQLEILKEEKVATNGKVPTLRAGKEQVTAAQQLVPLSKKQLMPPSEGSISSKKAVVSTSVSEPEPRFVPNQNLASQAPVEVQAPSIQSLQQPAANLPDISSFNPGVQSVLALLQLLSAAAAPLPSVAAAAAPPLAPAPPPLAHATATATAPTAAPAIAPTLGVAATNKQVHQADVQPSPQPALAYHSNLQQRNVSSSLLSFGGVTAGRTVQQPPSQSELVSTANQLHQNAPVLQAPRTVKPETNLEMLATIMSAAIRQVKLEPTAK